MIRLLPRFARCDGGSSAAEFALVLPLLLIFLFGIIDIGRALWTWNQAEKATQMGVRYAVVANLVPGGLASYNFATSGIPQGDPVPPGSFGGAACLSTGCSCKSASCPWLGTTSSTAFTNIVNRMRLFMPVIQADNVRVDYDYAGLGYSGDPNGPDVAPLVTVRLTGIQFKPITLFAFSKNLTLPDFRAALTLEDGDGTASN